MNVWNIQDMKWKKQTCGIKRNCYGTKTVRHEYFDTEHNKRQKGDIYILQIIDEEMKADDLRLR